MQERCFLLNNNNITFRTEYKEECKTDYVKKCSQTYKGGLNKIVFICVWHLIPDILFIVTKWKVFNILCRKSVPPATLTSVTAMATTKSATRWAFIEYRVQTVRLVNVWLYFNVSWLACLISSRIVQVPHQHCKQIAVPQCHSVPKKSCHSVPVQVPDKKCKEVKLKVTV